MPRARPPSKRPRMKACKKCGALVDSSTNICPVCGSTEFTDNWEGIIVILDPSISELAKELGIEKAGLYAIRVAGRTIKRTPQ